MEDVTLVQEDKAIGWEFCMFSYDGHYWTFSNNTNGKCQIYTFGREPEGLIELSAVPEPVMREYLLWKMSK